MKLAKITDTIGRLFVIKQFNITKITSVIMDGSAVYQTSYWFVRILRFLPPPKCCFANVSNQNGNDQKSHDDSHPLCHKHSLLKGLFQCRKGIAYRMSTPLPGLSSDQFHDTNWLVVMFCYLLLLLFIN